MGLGLRSSVQSAMPSYRDDAMTVWLLGDMLLDWCKGLRIPNPII